MYMKKKKLRDWYLPDAQNAECQEYPDYPPTSTGQVVQNLPNT